MYLAHTHSKLNENKSSNSQGHFVSAKTAEFEKYKCYLCSQVHGTH